MSQHKREMKRAIRRRALCNHEARMAKEIPTYSTYPADVPTTEAISRFETMMHDKAVALHAALTAAEAKRQRRKARNLINSAAARRPRGDHLAL